MVVALVVAQNFMLLVMVMVMFLLFQRQHLLNLDDQAEDNKFQYGDMRVWEHTLF